MTWLAALADANSARLAGGEMGALKSVGLGESRSCNCRWAVFHTGSCPWAAFVVSCCFPTTALAVSPHD